MEVIFTKQLKLYPIGQVDFTFHQPRGTAIRTKIYILNLDIRCETDLPITPEQEKLILKQMKKCKSDLLTDGRDFYTTRGNVVTQIKHKEFQNILDLHIELYGSDFEEYFDDIKI